MNVRTAWICCLLAGTVIFHCEGIKWLGLYRFQRGTDAVNSNHFTHNECNRARSHFGFKKRQLRYCKNANYSFSMSSIHYASKVAIYYCRKTFENRRWNCSSTKELPRVSKDLQRGTQEQAVVYAFASAALTYSIGRSCSSKNAYCPCVSDPSQSAFLTNQTHKWGNCDDNMKMAENFVVRFLGLRRRKKSARRPSPSFDFERGPYSYRQPRALAQRHYKRRGRRRKRSTLRLMNHHNYEAGIRLMDKWRSYVCKCHGLSGSCSTKVCFYRLTRIDHQGLRNAIRSKYMNAVMVKKSDNRLVSAHHKGKIVKPTDLVCINRSPDYCTPDPEVGSLGTTGRKCVKDASDSSNCEEMCCGRGYVIVHEQYMNRTCTCRLVGRFNVKCTPCRQSRITHVCN